MEEDLLRKISEIEQMEEREFERRELEISEVIQRERKIHQLRQEISDSERKVDRLEIQIEKIKIEEREIGEREIGEREIEEREIAESEAKERELKLDRLRKIKAESEREKLLLREIIKENEFEARREIEEINAK